ncbi:unnamed protein product [Phytophthora lilii]|uniref:Unnamed protein product n=1 Tax=Phytophthora lilii TaxID=2077276 RepID=A0A9W6X690_9STRA|nr:unnamed protein product [Phytophthora lilii]
MELIVSRSVWSVNTKSAIHVNYTSLSNLLLIKPHVGERLEKARQYAETNKEKIKARMSQRIECGCGVSHSRGNLSSHRRSKKHSGRRNPSLEPDTTQLNTMPFPFRISKRKGKKYDAVFDDGRVVSFGGTKRNGEPYQQYRDITPLRAFSEYDHGNIE